MSRTLEELEPIVSSIMKAYPITRDDDKVLYYRVLTALGYNTNLSLREYLLDVGDYPKYDSVTRCRRKIQEHDETLIGNRKVRAMRLANQEPYVEYAIGGRLFDPDEVEE